MAKIDGTHHKSLPLVLGLLLAVRCQLKGNGLDFCQICTDVELQVTGAKDAGARGGENQLLGEEGELPDHAGNSVALLVRRHPVLGNSTASSGSGIESEAMV